MTFKLAIACAVVLSGSLSAGQITVPIAETSTKNSPLRNSGTATLAQENVGASTFLSDSETWTVKNVSTKPIITLIEQISVIYPDGSKSIRKSQYELFFHSKPLSPGSEVSLSEDPQRLLAQRRTAVSEHNAEPRCEMAVLWVQFADGSTFGDRANAESLILDRRAVLRGLSHLRQTYLNQSAQAFVDEVQGPGDGTLFDVYLDQLKSYFQSTKDVSGTYMKLMSWLETADSREQFMR